MKVRVRKGYVFFDRGKAFTADDGEIEVSSIEGQSWKVEVVEEKKRGRKKNIEKDTIVNRSMAGSSKAKNK